MPPLLPLHEDMTIFDQQLDFCYKEDFVTTFIYSYHRKCKLRNTYCKLFFLIKKQVAIFFKGSIK